MKLISTIVFVIALSGCGIKTHSGPPESSVDPSLAAAESQGDAKGEPNSSCARADERKSGDHFVDGKVNRADELMVQKYWGNPYTQTDLDAVLQNFEGGAVDQRTIDSILLGRVRPIEEGDLNADGKINIVDLLIIEKYWGNPYSQKDLDAVLLNYQGGAANQEDIDSVLNDGC